MINNHCKLFADDLVVYSEIRDQADVARLQKDMDRLTAWDSTWVMKFHPDKCETIIITRKCKPHESSYPPRGHTLKKTNKVKYLGVNISSKLEWTKNSPRPTRPWASLKETSRMPLK